MGTPCGFPVVPGFWLFSGRSPAHRLGADTRRTCAGEHRGGHHGTGVDREPEPLRVTAAGGRPTLTAESEPGPRCWFEWEIQLGPVVALPRGGQVTLELEFFDQGAGLIDPKLQFDAGPGGADGAQPAQFLRAAQRAD